MTSRAMATPAPAGTPAPSQTVVAAQRTSVPSCSEQEEEGAPETPALGPASLSHLSVLS